MIVWAKFLFCFHNIINVTCEMDAGLAEQLINVEVNKNFTVDN